MHQMEDHELALVKGNQAFAEGDRARAEKWYRKSLNIKPTASAQSALDNLLSGGSAPASSGGSASASGAAESGASQPPPRPTPREAPQPQAAPRPTPPAAQPAASAAPRPDSKASSAADKEAAAGGYTNEQREAAIRIKAMKNYYEILSVERTATDQELKSSYRKLALRFHPDKNRAPEAKEAFILIGNAFACLSDPKKRDLYNVTGEDPTQNAPRSASQSRGGGGDGEYQQEYEQQDITPEEMFRMFFGGGAASFRSRRGRAQYYSGGFPRHHFEQQHQHQQQHAEGEEGAHPHARGQASSVMQLVHFLPLLLLFLFSFLGNSTHEDTPFSLDRTADYSIARETSSWAVPYYVNANFARRYGRDNRAIAQVESSVEHAYVERLTKHCEQEKKDQKRAISEARKVKTDQMAELLAKAHSMPLRHCEKLRDLDAVR